MPLVSVIIPTFNRFDQTADAVESALRQTETDLEVVVVDDMSSDTSLDRLRERFPLANVKFVSTGRNSGAATGRNIGVEASSGEYVAFLDSDDIWWPEKISRQLEILRSNGFCPSDACLVYSPAQLQARNGALLVNPTRPIFSSERVEEYMFVSGQHVQTSGWLMSRQFFDAVRFTPGLRRHQDLDFVIRAQAKGCKFLMAPEALYEWRHGTHVDHVGKIKDDGLSLAWLNSVKPVISKKAYHHFGMNYLFPAMLPVNKTLAAKIVMNAALDGEPFLEKTLRTIVRRLLGR
jgi:glycosyltransferase involved in cell wall biosynthesis